MAEFEYKKIETVLGNNWHVVVDNDWLFYPCGENLDEVKAFAEAYKEELKKILGCRFISAAITVTLKTVCVTNGLSVASMYFKQEGEAK